MRLLHVIDKSFIGGGQAAVKNLVRGLSGSGIEAQVACRNGGPLVADLRAMGTRVQPIPFDKHFRPGPAYAIAKLVRQSKIDVIHSHGLVATTYCTMARSMFGVTSPLIYHQHGFGHHNYGKLTLGLRKASERAVCRRADAVIAASHADVTELVEGGYAPAGRVRMILYGIPDILTDPAATEAVRGEFAIPRDAPVVGLVARLHPQKSVDTFLRAATLIRKKIPNAVFVVVGTGELERQLHALAASLGLGDSVRWVGGRPSTPFVLLFDVAVISSAWEGLPLTLLEYMATRRAIVTTDVAGCLQAVGPNEAEIVPRSDPAAMAEAALRLLGSPQVAESRREAARQKFVAHFTLGVMAGRFISLYKELAQ